MLGAKFYTNFRNSKAPGFLSQIPISSFSFDYKDLFSCEDSPMFYLLLKFNSIRLDHIHF